MRKRNKKTLMVKKIIVVLAAVVLLVSATIGGTLAWLTDDTQTVTNTFTVGNIDITLVESDTDKDGDPNDNDYKILPGSSYVKDPVVTVLADSEDCYLFVKVEKPSWTIGYQYILDADGNKVFVTNNDGNKIVAKKATGITVDPELEFEDFVTYALNLEGWTLVPYTENVYYREVTSSTSDTSFNMLTNVANIDDANGSIKIDGETVNKSMIDVLDTAIENSVLTNSDLQIKFTAYAVQLYNNGTKFTVDDAWAKVNP